MNYRCLPWDSLSAVGETLAMNGKKNQTSESGEGKKVSAGNDIKRPIRKGGHDRKDGKAEGDARRKIEGRTFVDSEGYSIRRREFRKNQHEAGLAAKKDERKKEILTAAAALAATADLV